MRTSTQEIFRALPLLLSKPTKGLHVLLRAPTYTLSAAADVHIGFGTQNDNPPSRAALS
jgi:hypothetical protein